MILSSTPPPLAYLFHLSCCNTYTVFVTVVPVVHIIILCYYYTEYELLASCGYPQPSAPLVHPHVHMEQFVGLSSAFLKMLSDVINTFDARPDFLNTLKRILGKLVLPVGNGEVVALIDPTIFHDMDLVRQLFRLLSPLLNCFSTDLIHYLCEQSHSLNLVEEFHRVCEQHSEAILCVKEVKGTGMNTDSDVASLPASLSPGHFKVHTMPLDTLQSLHPLVFTRLNHHRTTQPPKTFRLSVEVNQPLITLQDYDNITDAVSAALLLPKIAMVYAGCSASPLTITWLVPAQLHRYLVTSLFGSTAGGDRLLAEQGVVSVAIGEDMYRVCLGMQVCISITMLQPVYYHIIGGAIEGSCLVWFAGLDTRCDPTWCGYQCKRFGMKYILGVTKLC